MPVRLPRNSSRRFNLYRYYSRGLLTLYHYGQQLLKWGNWLLVWGIVAGGGWLHYHPQSLEQLWQLTQRLGLSLERVEIDIVPSSPGAVHITHQEVIKLLSLRHHQPLLSYNLSAMKERVQQLPWVRSVAIERRLPDAISLRIIERAPVARWQYQRQYYLIDADGNAIVQLDRQRHYPYHNLLLIVGKGANLHAAELLRLLQACPDISKLVIAATYVGERRWNLLLKNNIEVKLPETTPDKALAHLAKLHQRKSVFTKKVRSIDARHGGKLIFRAST